MYYNSMKKSLKFNECRNRSQTRSQLSLTPAHLNTEHHTAEVAEEEPAAAVHHNQPVAGTVGTADL